MRLGSASVLALTMFVSGLGCQRNDKTQATGGSRDNYALGSKQGSSVSNDSTNQLNATDNLNTPSTPEERGASKADLEVTRRIRGTIMNDPDLSDSARNIKIITLNGKVSLRGAVNSINEARAIASVARREAGFGSVDNQLEVKANK